MSLEILNTIATIGTFVVIGATAVTAVIQLKHLRASNQLAGLLSVLSRVEDPIFNEWLDRSKAMLSERLPNPEYRRSIFENAYDRENNPWLNMCNSYEWVGSLIKHDLIPEEPFMDVYSGRILSAWDVLQPVVAIVRRRADPSIWENFEYLVVRAKMWERQNPLGAYPKHTPRASLDDVWIEQDSVWLDSHVLWTNPNTDGARASATPGNVPEQLQR